MASRTSRIRSMPSIPRCNGSSVSHTSICPRIPAIGASCASWPSTTTRSTRARTSGSTGIGAPPCMDAPTSETACADREFSDPPGAVPAEWTSTRSPARARMSAAAIWDFPPFLTHTNNTDGVVDMTGSFNIGRPTGV